MTNLTHIMVDLETWGTTPGSHIRSIGAVVFDPVAGTLGDSFYVNIDGSGETVGLSCDPATVQWWAEQSAEARQQLEVNQRSIWAALNDFAVWWWRLGGADATFWAHGPHFDEAILAACYRAIGVPVPWHFRAPRDTRTIYEAAGGVELPFEGTKHSALDDATHQARCVIEAYRKIRGRENPGEEALKSWRANDPDAAPDGTLESLAQVATMLETWGAEALPANELGQVHFARCLMDSAAAEIRAYLSSITSHGGTA